MSDDRLNRRLAAVLAADVVAYSAMMSRDEVGTFERVKALIDDLMTPAIEGRGDGRVVKHTGDGLLAEFHSTVDAVRAAVAIQAALASQNKPLAAEERLDLRIGVNLGEIIIDTDGDIHGDGVNVAVRLESLADPNGIFVSGEVYRRARSDKEIVFERVGTRRVKNIPDKVEVYRVVSGPSLAAIPRGAPRGQGRSRARSVRPALGGVAVLFLIAAGGYWGLTTLGSAPPPAITNAGNQSFASSVAILRVRNETGDKSLDHIADGLAEGIASALSRLKDVSVAAPSTSDSYAAKPEGFRKASVDLKVRYVLTGRVVKDKNSSLRLHLLMTDVPAGLIVFDRSFSLHQGKLISLRAKVSEQLSSVLSGSMTELLGSGISKKGKATTAAGDSSNEDAYDAYLRGLKFARTRTPESYADALAQFRKAARLDPRYGRARAAMASLYLDIATQSWYRHPALKHLGLRNRGAAVALAAEELENVPLGLAVGHRVRARLAALRRDTETAIVEAGKAAELDPRDPENHFTVAVVRLWNGEVKYAERAMKRAMDLNPRAPARYLTFLGMIRFAAEDYESAADLIGKAHQRNPKSWQKLVHLVAAYGHLGKKAEARKAIAEMNRLRAEIGRPNYTISQARRFSLYRDSALLNRLLEGLRLAGLP